MTAFLLPIQQQAMTFVPFRAGLIPDATSLPNWSLDRYPDPIALWDETTLRQSMRFATADQYEKMASSIFVCRTGLNVQFAADERRLSADSYGS